MESKRSAISGRRSVRLRQPRAPDVAPWCDAAPRLEAGRRPTKCDRKWGGSTSMRGRAVASVIDNIASNPIASAMKR